MISYDLHVHTCLSPSADDSMTPVKVIDKAVENGLDIIAITDTNSTSNLQVAFDYAKDKIAFVPGIEIQSKEEVNMVCLFPDMTSVRRMEAIMLKNMTSKRNKPRAFGNQNIVDESDKIIAVEEKLLSFPTAMTIEEIIFAAKQMKGVAFYGNMEAKAYSVLSTLGSIPKWPEVKAFEFSNTEKGRAQARIHALKTNKLFLYSSNAKRLEDINTRENSEDLEKASRPYSPRDGKASAESFIEWLKSFSGV